MKQCIVCILLAILLAASIAIPSRAQSASDSSQTRNPDRNSYAAQSNPGVDYNYLGLLGLLGLYGLHGRRKVPEQAYEQRRP